MSPVTILYGALAADAPPDERDVLIEVEAVEAALKRLGYAVATLPVSLNLQHASAYLRQQRPAFVFNLVESLDGRGRFCPVGAALLEETKVPYTGASSTALFMSSSKLLAKRLLKLCDIDTPDWRAAESDAAADGRWIIKSVWEHASIGIDDDSVVDACDVTEMLAARRKRLGGEWFAERFVEGREFNIALIENTNGPQVLPPAEIEFENFPNHKPRIVGYAAKWQPDSFESMHTPRTFDFGEHDHPLLETLGGFAGHCWSLFECRGYARVDFRVDEAGRPWVLEVNANPCLAPDAGFAAAAARAGFSYDEVIERIVNHVSHP
ncbi:MAG: D-alanine--D-alanine ligase [Gammaproteobacteria bacterium]|nr:D-alanine--D-alanine ligase [Gammaproteobacteria bacterium]MBA3731478.1 D-alanine--D-alanine ligase [Gammaproteobacteria bacterium]